jgi:predicted TIM-barrel fold metal-dependent hydrolase
MMIVDAHTHIAALAFDSAYNPYGMQREGVEAYLRAMELNHVSASFVFGQIGFRDCSRFEEENRALAALGRQHTDCLIPWGSLNPNWSEDRVERAVNAVADDPHLFGIKLVPILQGFPISSAGMDAVARAAVGRSLPVFFHDGSPEYCSAVQVLSFARRYPELTVVSGHGGLREQWREYARHARDAANLWICLSGPTQAGIQRLYESLGPDRLLFGSDGGLGHPSVTKAYLRRLERLEAPDEDKRKILGENALRLIGRVA